MFTTQYQDFTTKRISAVRFSDGGLNEDDMSDEQVVSPSQNENKGFSLADDMNNTDMDGDTLGDMPDDTDMNETDDDV